MPMKTLVIYYSFTGHTRAAAKKIAQAENADIIEVKETKKRSKLNAYVAGSFAAMRHKEAVLQEYACDFAAYDRIVIAVPIWAGHPAPAFNNIINLLPSGKEVELVMISGGGNSGSSAEKTKQRIADRGCRVTKYLDQKA